MRAASERNHQGLHSQAGEPARTQVPSLPILDSTALLRGAREVLILHAGTTYRLLHTRNDKLILTK